ncbi:unnamed protein product, partial [marine sediment metagenome]
TPAGLPRPGDRLLLSPDTQFAIGPKRRRKIAKHKRCPCEAFALADSTYTANPRVHKVWRAACRGSALSPYDYFMRINLKRLMLGIKGVLQPPPRRPMTTYLLGEGDFGPPDLCKFCAVDTVRF